MSALYPPVESLLGEDDFMKRAPTPGTARDDEEYCQSLSCPLCSCQALDYSPWYHPAQRIYTAWAICPICGLTEMIQEPITI